jgi:hypothetical protein
MPRYNELDGHLGRRVRAITLDGKQIEGVLQSVAHLDADDALTIGNTNIRLGKLQKLFLLEDGSKFRLWPPYDAGEVEPEAEPVEVQFDPALYEKAVALVSHEVIVQVGTEIVAGVLEAVSSEADTHGPVLHISQGEGQPTVNVRLGAVTKIGCPDDEGRPPLTADELERAILPGADDYPFNGKAKRRASVERIAASVVKVSAEYDEPIVATMAAAARFYGLDEIATQAVQTLIARTQEIESNSPADASYPADAEVDPVDGGLLAPPA